MTRSRTCSISLALLCFASAAHADGGIGTAITVQGVFSDEGVPLNNDVDLIVGLFDAPTDGNEVAPAVRIDAVPAVDGLVTVSVDFGPDAFSGQPRFLEFSIRNPHDPDDIEPFVLLDGRIAVTPTPESLHAQRADNAATAETVTAPLSLTLDDAGAPTLRVANVAVDGVGLEVQGDLTVGPAGEFHIDAETGNVLSLGSVTASGAIISGDALVGRDLATEGFLTVGPEERFFVRPDNGSFAAGSSGPNDAMFYLNAATPLVASTVDFSVLDANLASKFSVDAQTGDTVVTDLLRVDGSTVLGDEAVDDTVRVNARFEVGPDRNSDPITFIQGTDGFLFAGNNIELEGALIDSADSSGEAGQFLSSTGSTTQWRELIVAPLDMKNFAIMNIGSGGSSFTGTGGLNLTDNLDLGGRVMSNIGINGSKFTDEGGLDLEGVFRVFAAQPPLLSDFAVFHEFTIVDNELHVSPETQLRMVVDDAGIRSSATLSVGPTISFEDAKFQVDSITGTMSTLGDVDVNGRYFDSSGDAGTDGQILSSTEVGTNWVDRKVFADGIAVPDEQNPKFVVQVSGITDILAPLTVTLTGGGPNPGESKAVSAVVDNGIAVDGTALQFGSGVVGIGMGASNAGVSASGFGGATGLSVGAFQGGDAIDVLGENRIGNMVGNSADPEGALKVENQGAGHTLVVAGGDGMHVEKSYFDSANSPGADGQLLGSTGAGTQWRNLIERDLDLLNFAITNIGTGGSSFSADGSLRVAGDVDATGGVFAQGSLGVDGPAFFSNEVTVTAGDVSIEKNLFVLGAYRDSADSPGADGQILGSTGTGTQWRNLIDRDLDAQNFAITNIGSEGSFFAPTGGLVVKPDFLVSGAEGQTAIFQADNFNVSAFRDFDVRTTDNSSVVFSVDNEQGNTTAEGYVEPKGGIRDEAFTLGAAGQVLTSTGSGVLWQDCDCEGGGGGDTCLTCTGDDAFFDGDVHAEGILTARDFFELRDRQGNLLVGMNPSSNAFTTPLDAQGSFNIVRNVVTDLLQVSVEDPVSPVIQVTTTANFAPMVRFFNFLGAADALSVIGNTEVDGDLDVTGAVSKGGGSFKIDHPLDPENKYLYHSFVESPDMMNIYNGNAVTDGGGYATIFLPDWFDTLNRDFRYQLTVIDDADGESFVMAKVVKRIEFNQFTIRTSEPFTEVSWQVTGIRQDAWANANRIPVEEFKPLAEQGKYLHPIEHGMPIETGVGYESRQDALRQRDAASDMAGQIGAGR